MIDFLRRHLSDISAGCELAIVALDSRAAAEQPVSVWLRPAKKLADLASELSSLFEEIEALCDA